jgi:8-oxo-dGTP pyrophosphatase MutT (NUDIX family)
VFKEQKVTVSKSSDSDSAFKTDIEAKQRMKKQIFLSFIHFTAAFSLTTIPAPKLSSQLSGGFYSREKRLPVHMDSSTSDERSEELTFDGGSAMTTLAGDYIVRISRNPDHSWGLFPLKGANAVKALSTPIIKEKELPVVELTCSRVEADALEVDVSSAGKAETVDSALLLVLQLIFLQYTARESATSTEYRISIGSSKDVLYSDLNSESGAEILFSSLIDDFTSVEWVEMVTGSGEILGKVPRQLVHSFNLLHRGIGLFVTKDEPMMDDGLKKFPSLYMHRRVDTKRIFPSLYDMFVGGVSLAEESQKLTARREVAEELGLSRALDDENALSDPILDCVVCTGYNRCFVTLFSYTMNTREEYISWQEEEVAWGDFVPYPIIEAAADRSIQRLAEKKEWPGAYPAIQSELKGAKPAGVSYESEDYLMWDFVPDGLLVWEAWLEKLKEEKTK